MKILSACVVLAAFSMASATAASSLERECIDVSHQWGSTGDVEAQCSCIADAVAGDDALTAEFLAFDENYSSDAEAYENASAAAKDVMDKCEVDG